MCVRMNVHLLAIFTSWFQYVCFISADNLQTPGIIATNSAGPLFLQNGGVMINRFDGIEYRSLPQGELLATMAAGVPGFLKKGIDIATQMTETTENFSRRIEDKMQQIEEKLRFFIEQLGVIATENVNLTKQAIESYRFVECKLQIARVNLRTLAKDTVRTCKIMISYMEGWAPTVSIQDRKWSLQKQLEAMEKLLEISNTILDKTNTEYIGAIRLLSHVGDNLDDFKRGIEEMLDHKSNKYKSWTKDVRAGVYTTAGVLTVGAIVLDFLFCMGICSVVVLGGVAAPSILVAEAEITRIKNKLDLMRTTVSGAESDVVMVRGDIEDLQTFLSIEIEVTTDWASAARSVHQQIPEIDDDSFYRLSFARGSFQISLKDLQNAAQAFINRPNLLGTNRLDNVLYNKFRQEQEEKSYNEVEKRKGNISGLTNTISRHVRMATKLYHSSPKRHPLDC